MKRAKPIRSFLVRVRVGAPQTIEGESFYLARATYCAETPGVHPDEVRLVLENAYVALGTLHARPT